MSLLAAVTVILTGNLAPGAVPVSLLAPAILETAIKHAVDPQLLARIVVVESAGRAAAVNQVTDDHGLLQINFRTAGLYNISTSCLHDWKCNLDAGAKILSDLLKIRGATACSFNLGPKGRFIRYKNACEQYESRLAAL